MVSGEVFGYEFKECSADVCLYVAAVRRVVPDDVSLSVSSRSGGLSLLVVIQRIGVSTRFKCSVVDRFCFVEFGFVAGVVRNSTVDGVW